MEKRNMGNPEQQDYGYGTFSSGEGDNYDLAEMQGGPSPIELLKRLFGKPKNPEEEAAMQQVMSAPPEVQAQVVQQMTQGGAPAEGQGASAGNANTPQSPVATPLPEETMPVAQELPPSNVMEPETETLDGLWGNPGAVAGAGAAAGIAALPYMMNQGAQGGNVPKIPPSPGQPTMPSGGNLPPPVAEIPQQQALPTPPNAGMPPPQGAPMIEGANPQQPQLPPSPNTPDQAGAIPLPDSTPGERVMMPTGEEFYIAEGPNGVIVRNVDGREVSDPMTMKMIQEQIRKDPSRRMRSLGNGILHTIRGLR